MVKFSADDPEANFNLSIRLLCTLSFVVLAAWLWYFGTDVHKIRQGEPKERFGFCRQLTINLCLMSAVLGIVQISELDDVDHGVGNVDFGKYIEWVFTCPLTQLQLMIFAGPDCTSVGVWTPCRLTFACLLTGAIASYFTDMSIKSAFFVLSCIFYLHLLYKLNIVVKEMSGGKDKLFWAKKPSSLLFTLVATSWSVFPILWILSPEGFNLSAGANFKIGIVTTVANAAVKLTFMAVFQHVRVKTLKEQVVEHQFRLSERSNKSHTSNISQMSKMSEMSQMSQMTRNSSEDFMKEVSPPDVEMGGAPVAEKGHYQIHVDEASMASGDSAGDSSWMGVAVSRDAERHMV